MRSTRAARSNEIMRAYCCEFTLPSSCSNIVWSNLQVGFHCGLAKVPETWKQRREYLPANLLVCLNMLSENKVDGFLIHLIIFHGLIPLFKISFYFKEGKKLQTKKINFMHIHTIRYRCHQTRNIGKDRHSFWISVENFHWSIAWCHALVWVEGNELDW